MIRWHGLVLGLGFLVASSCNDDGSDARSTTSLPESNGGATGGNSGGNGGSKSGRHSSSSTTSLQPGQCSDDQAYCDGKVAHYCSGNDKHPFEWEVEQCADNEICIQGDCLTEPLEPCSRTGEEACAKDGRQLGFCAHSGYYRWYAQCDSSAGETCLPDDAEFESWVGCVIPSMGACSTRNASFCRGNQGFICSSLYWKRGPVCDPARGEACFTGHDELGRDWTRCIVESLGACSGHPPTQCYGDVVVSCSVANRWAETTDCAASGQVCRDGYCAIP